MIENILENWLTNSNERTYQIPLCHLLRVQGHNVIHMTRHCGMELGKDIISIDSEGNVCAFQLKNVNSERMTLSQWREINSQIYDMVNLELVHPSLNKIEYHEHYSYLVVNSYLDEEVARAIDDFNRGQDRQKQKNKLFVISKGDLITWGKESINSVWPKELKDINTFLTLYLKPGCELIPKEEFGEFFKAFFNFENDKNLNLVEINRICSSFCVVVSILSHQYIENENHVSEVELWSMALFYIIGFGLKNGISDIEGINSIHNINIIIHNALMRLLDELKERDDFYQGDIIADKFIINARITHVNSLLVVLSLWEEVDKQGIPDKDKIREIILKNKNRLYLWGEYCGPQILSIFFYMCKHCPEISPQKYLFFLVDYILISNKDDNNLFLANPYYDFIYVHNRLLGFKKEQMEESFDGDSFLLKPLIFLMVKHLWRQNLSLRWHEISKFTCRYFEPEDNWMQFLWRVDKGSDTSEVLKHTQSWNELLELVKHSKNVFPTFLIEHPYLILLFIIVYPHRINSDNILLLDELL